MADLAVKSSNLKQQEKKTQGLMKKEPFRQYFLRNKWLYILLIPGMLYILIFRYIPMYGIIIAFKEFDLVKGIWNSPWIGLENFKYLLSFPDFYDIFKNSILISIYRLAWGFPAPILLALMLNEVRNQKYKKLVQTVVYLPHFISWVVIAGMIYNILSPTGGLLNYIIVDIFGGDAVAFLQQPLYFRSIIVISDIWKEAGWGTIIYLAAMSSIDSEIYEAAKIDGAGRIQRIWHITIPGIMTTVVVLLILRMGSVLRNGFEQIFMLYNPLVYEVADVFETFTYRVGMIDGRFSFATAVGVFQSIVGLLLIYASNRLAKKYGDGGLW